MEYLPFKLINYSPDNVSAELLLKVPGNDAVHHSLKFEKIQNSEYDYQLVGNKKLPLMLYQNIEGSDNCKRITMLVVALEDVYFNYGQLVKTASRHDDCLFYMPGFWYRRNLRSPKEAPSFHTSDSWIVREDRLSTPLTAIYDEKKREKFFCCTYR